MDTDALPPRPAATVILARRGSKHRDSGLEVLMGRRTPSAKFMPDVWVFPGGALEDADVVAARRALGTEAPIVEIEEMAHRICGARELHEEVAVSIPEPSELKPWARWITPLEVSIRFDTRFYVGLAPPHSAPEPDGVEIVDAAWISPADALESHFREEIKLVFPTIRQLEALAPHSSADDLLAAAPPEPVAPILPRIIGDGDDRRVMLDPDESLMDSDGRHQAD